jgi:hypothetical protein
LQLDTEIWLPQGHGRMEEYYLRVRDACVKWAERAEGERLCEAYRAIEDHMERARFQTASYRLICSPVWEESLYAVYLCRSALQIGGERKERVMAQVWNTEEETILPMGQVIKSFPAEKSKKRIPFRPDGVYPLDGELVFYRNARDARSYGEYRMKRQK